jgi:hypothetical protein
MIHNNKMDIETKSNDTNIVFSRYIFWRLELYSECTIWKDEQWWEENKIEYLKFWNEFLYHCNDNCKELLAKKESKKRGPRQYNNKDICLIIDDIENTRNVSTLFDIEECFILMDDDDEVPSINNMNNNKNNVSYNDCMIEDD